MPFVRSKEGSTWVDGPKEAAVRATLPSRPAGIIQNVENNVNGCFAGFFNGCLSKGSLHNGHLSIGKSECEWDWEETWGKLRELGLITWTTEQVPNHHTIGGHTTYVHLTITDKGWEVRNDDLKWFRELMDARDQDEAEMLKAKNVG